MNYAFVWKPMCKFPALRFDRLKRRFPELDSSRQFVEQDLYAGNIRIDVTALEITPDVICAAVEEALKRIVPVVEADVKEYEGTRVFKGKKLNALITDKTCVYADPETGTDGLGISQNESPKWAIDLSREDWFAFEDNFGTTEEKNFVMHFKGLAERLRPSFANIWLVRNSFKEGRRFEPDYILFLKRSKNSSKTEQIQVFVEPKGEHLIENDKWKEEFLLEIERTGHPVFDVADTMEYKIVGCHFYNERLAWNEANSLFVKGSQLLVGVFGILPRLGAFLRARPAALLAPEPDVFAGRMLQPEIPRARNAAVLFRRHDFDAGVFRCVRGKNLRRGVRRAVV